MESQWQHGTILVDGDDKILWFRRPTGYKWCCMLSARALGIALGDDDCHGRWISNVPDARFQEVAELREVCQLNIKPRIRTQLLSQGTAYTAYLVMRLSHSAYGLDDHPLETEISVGGVQSSIRDIRLQGRRITPQAEVDRLWWSRFPEEEDGVGIPRPRGDGWMEVEMGHFTVTEGGGDEMVEVTLKGTEILKPKCCLIVHGLEFRPSICRRVVNFCGDQHQPVEERPSQMLRWETPSAYKKGCVISARALDIVWGSDTAYWTWISDPTSRFPEVAELKAVCWMDIKGSVESGQLSRGTKYRAYLVMRLTDSPSGLDDPPQESEIFVGDALSSTRVIRLQRRDRHNDDGDGDGDDDDDDVRVPHPRGDGWMEVELGDFFIGEDVGDVSVSMRLKQHDDYVWKSGLVVHGILVRPEIE